MKKYTVGFRTTEDCTCPKEGFAEVSEIGEWVKADLAEEMLEVIKAVEYKLSSCFGDVPEPFKDQVIEQIQSIIKKASGE